MYCGTAGEMNFYGVTKESGEKRKSNFVVPNTVKETGTDAQGNPTYAANDIEVTNAQAYYTRLRSINESYIYDSSFIKLREPFCKLPGIRQQMAKRRCKRICPQPHRMVRA